MNFVYSSSDSYCEIAGISMYSLMENNKSAEEINIYLIDNHISEANKKRLNDMVASFGRKLHYVQLLDIEERAGIKINIGRWNISTFGRLFLGTLLPESVEKVLFIDCDTLILQDLTPLWEKDMEGKWLWGADDCRGEAYRTNIGLQPTDNYINNGVLLMDLKAWREEKVEEKLLQFIRECSGDITFVDQGVQNGVISKLGKSGLLPPKYNSITIYYDFTYENILKLRKPPVHGNAEDYKEARENPAIVHFQSCFRSGVRPWTKGCKHPLTGTYLAYKAKTPWKDEPFRPDDRTIPQKLLKFGTDLLPENLMVDLVSIVHAKIYPMARNLKQKLVGKGK